MRFETDETVVSDTKREDKEFKSDCKKLTRKVNSLLKTQGIIIAQASIDYFKTNEIVSLPFANLNRAETIEIYETCIREHKQKLVNRTIKPKTASK